MASERNREPNFKLEEIEFLVECCAKKIGILENKKIDGKTLAAKNLTWALIANEFKENPATLNRSKDQLFNRWKSLKTQAKKILGEYKRSKNSTGGGPPPKTPPDLFLRIANLIPNQFERINCVFDSDNLGSSTIENDSQANEDEMNAESENRIESQNSAALVEESEMKQPAPKIRKFESQQFSKNDESSTRIELMNLQKTYMEEEHKAKMELFKLKKEAAIAKKESALAKMQFYNSKSLYLPAGSEMNLNQAQESQDSQNNSLLLLSSTSSFY